MILIQPIEFIQFGPDVLNTIGPAPLSITPTSMLVGQSINATVTGTRFTNTTTFSLGTGIAISSLVIVNSTTATMVLTSTSTTPLGAHDLTATDNTISTTLVGAFLVLSLTTGDFFDYIFQFPDQGSFLRDPLIQKYAPSVLGSQPGVQLLIYNPVETLNPPTPTVGNTLVIAPQLAQSTVALPGFWAMLTIQSSSFIPELANHPNLQILNDRTLMFGGNASVVLTKIDVSHINIVINVYGVYVADGLKTLPRTFFISSAGNNNNNGISQTTPWRTVGRVNAEVMLPGDTYSFRGGDTFSDATLTTNASGSQANSITFQSYGTGNATISRAAASGFLSINRSYITIQNLIFTGSGGTTQAGVDFEYPSGSNSGVLISGLTVSGFASDGIRVFSNGGSLNGLTIQDCVSFKNCNVDPGQNNIGTAGINVGSETGFAAVLNGVYLFFNVTIQRCVSHDNPGSPVSNNWTGSGIFLAECNGGLITECVSHDNGVVNAPFGTVGIWTADSNAVTIQYCESYKTHTQTGSSDGDGFDLESGSTNCTIQYCYSHDNDGHGFLLESGQLPSSNIVCRFNISQNDAQNTVTFNNGGICLAANGQYDNVNPLVYGNTVYGTSNTLFCSCFEYQDLQSPGRIRGGIVANNIFYSAVGQLSLVDSAFFTVPDIAFRGNLYFATNTFQIFWNNAYRTSLVNFQAQGQEKISGNPVGLQADPKLTSPGGGGNANAGSFVTPAQLAAITAYKLAHSTPAFHAGLNVTTQFGINPGPLDFYSNAITASTLSIGANCPISAP